MSRPKGLGGFHKKRAPNPKRGKGKSGGFRVYFLEVVEVGVIVLALLSDKDMEANISARDQSRLKSLAVGLREEVVRYAKQKQRS